MIYLDSNLFIFVALSPESEPVGASSRGVLERVVSGNLAAATASLTWDEIVWKMRKLVDNKVALSKGEEFLSTPELGILPVKESTIRVAQGLSGKYNLKPRDAIHAACCIENHIDKIVSDDRDFDRIKEIRRLPIEKATRL